MTGSSGSAPLPRAHVDKSSTAYRVRRMLRKFGPFTLIVLLLFGIKYFLISILVNLHYVKTNMQEQCDPHLGMMRVMEVSKNQHWAQHKMVGRGAYGFVQWSSYRISASQIVAVGFGASVLRDHRKATTCAWHGEDGKSLPGEPRILYPQAKTDSFQYEPIIVSCTLTGRVATYLGGHATVTLDKEHIVVYREDTNSPGQRDPVGRGGSQHRVAFCTFPVAEAVEGERMREWIDIHKYVGATHVVAYDAGGLDRRALEHLREYIRSGFLEITAMREVALYDIRSHGKIIAMHDCLYRSALTSNWVVYLDWDDVLFLQSPRFLSILLDDHKDAPWLTYGTRVYSTKLCLAPGVVPGSARGFRGTAKGLVPFPQERMVYHWPHYLCTDESVKDKKMCPGEPGMRYLIVNPNKVTLVASSEVVDPSEGGVVLSADEVRHDRYEGLHKEGMSGKWCKEPHGADETVEWWVKGEEVHNILAEVRKELEGKNK